jgi:hypothetical protein
MDGTHLAQDRQQWWDLVDTVTNFRIPQKARNFKKGCATWSYFH